MDQREPTAPIYAFLRTRFVQALKPCRTILSLLIFVGIFSSVFMNLTAVASGQNESLIKCVNLLPRPSVFWGKVKQTQLDFKISLGVTSEKREKLRSIYSELLKKALSQVRTSSQLVSVFADIESIGPDDDAFVDAVTHADLLSPLRPTLHQLSGSELQIILDFLFEYNDEPTAQMKMWNSILQATLIEQKPEYAETVVAELLNYPRLLKDDFIITGERVNRSLIRSLSLLPQETKEKILTQMVELEKAVVVSDSPSSKVPRRNIQLIRRILLDQEFNLMLAQVKSASGSGSKLFLVEDFLLKLNGIEPKYSLNSVAELSTELRSLIRQDFKRGSWIEIFGSYSNLSANFATSDLDMILSSELQGAYKEWIKGGNLGYGSVLHPQNIITDEAKAFLESMRALSFKVHQAWKSDRVPEEIISVTFKNFYQSSTILRYLTMHNPITFQIWGNKVMIRIYDSLSPIPGEEAKLYEFKL